MVLLWFMFVSDGLLMISGGFLIVYYGFCWLLMGYDVFRMVSDCFLMMFPPRAERGDDDRRSLVKTNENQVLDRFGGPSFVQSKSAQNRTG